VVLSGAIALGCYLFAGVMVVRYRNLSKYGYGTVRQGDGVYIAVVDQQGPAAGKLQVGDKILALNDDTRVSRIGPFWKLNSVPLGQPYTMRIERHGGEQQIELKQVLFPISIYRVKVTIFTCLPLSLAFYLVALLIGMAKPEEKIARLAFGVFFLMAFNWLFSAIAPLAYLFDRPEIYIFFLIHLFSGGGLYLPLGYHLCYRFPPGVPQGRFWAFLRWPLYVCGAIVFFAGLLLDRISLSGQMAMAFYFNQTRLLQAYSIYNTSLTIAGTIAICAVLVRNYRLVEGANQRYRIKWVIYGSVAGVLPFIVLNVGSFISKIAGSSPVFRSQTFYTLEVMVSIALVMVPASWGYAIVKHRVFDINLVIRRGLQYLLAKNVLRLMLALPLIGVAYGIIANPDRTLKDLLLSHLTYPLLIAAAALSLKFRRQLSEWVDRKFFREAYRQEQILLGLIDEIQGLDSMSEISKLVSRQLEAALHPQRLNVYYREAEKLDLTLGYYSGSHSEHLTIAAESQLLRLMEGERSAQAYPFAPNHALPPAEQAWLDQLGIHLLVPMSGADGQLMGLLLLGEKKSEEPYTPTDRRLLEAVAKQIAVVYENVWLKGRVDQDAKVQREVLARLEERQVNLVKECPACGACFDSTEQVCPKDHSKLALSLPVERTIEGKYRLEQLLGKGGMGAVYQATDLRLGRKVAIKVLTGSMFGDRTALRRFEREARASARLNHPNIITVYDYGGIRTEGAYLVMELVPGPTLRAELKRAGSLPPVVAARWFEQVLEGVKAAHGAGVIHRDLKPENILITSQEPGRPLIKVLDFGLAKFKLLETADPNSLTAPGTVMGTFGYMSPEQLSGEDVDERTDIFSLGVMVVEALTGNRPFSGRTHGALLNSILHQPFQLKSSVKEVQRLDAVLQKCLAKDRTGRFASVAELQTELIPALNDCPPLAAPEAVNVEGGPPGLSTK